MTRREWRQSYEERATPAQLDFLYENDLHVHHPEDKFCPCDACMDELIQKSNAAAQAEIQQLMAAAA